MDSLLLPCKNNSHAKTQKEKKTSANGKPPPSSRQDKCTWNHTLTERKKNQTFSFNPSCYVREWCSKRWKGARHYLQPWMVVFDQPEQCLIASSDLVMLIQPVLDPFALTFMISSARYSAILDQFCTWSQSKHYSSKLLLNNTVFNAAVPTPYPRPPKFPYPQALPIVSFEYWQPSIYRLSSRSTMNAWWCLN